MADDEVEEASRTTADEAADATGVPASGGGDGADGGDGGDGSDGEPENEAGGDPDRVAAAGLVGDSTDEEEGDEEDGGGGAGSATADQEGDGADEADGFDVEAAETRLEDVEGKIEEGRRALADLENEVEPEPEGQPIAEGEGAANAPPG